jgi:hypothetical protein
MHGDGKKVVLQYFPRWQKFDVARFAQNIVIS